MPDAAFGVDAGGTFTKIAFVTARGKILRMTQIPTRPQDGPAAFVGRVAEVLGAWRREGLRARALGFGVAGDVDHEGGRLRVTPNLPGWSGFRFRDAFQKRLRLPTVVENDANCAVWGAYVTELKRRPRTVIGVTLGTGVGGGLVVDGRLHRGATGSAGEIGHTQVVIGGAPCHCGNRGCLEAYAGKYGILREARRRLRAQPRRGRRLRALMAQGGPLSPHLLKLAADRGDGLAREVWERTGSLLGVGLCNAVLLLNPDAVLLLGGVSQAGRWILGPIRRVFAGWSFGTSVRAAVLRCALNAHGGCVGAAHLALEERPSR
ncbi:MAG: ROK family protein [Elusimicrobia bacterium]|nr:ROK family protein [Elusimicrobiota bacterium]